MDTLRLANLALRFLLEVGALVAIGRWGWTASAPPFARAALAVVLPVAMAIVWGLFIAPKARFPTGVNGRAILGLVVFLVAAASLHARGHTRLAMSFGALAIVSAVLLVALPEPDTPRSP